MGISFRLFYKLIYVRNSCFLHFFFGPQMMANPTLVDDKENTSNSSGKHGKGNLFNSLVNWKMLEGGRTVSPWPSSVLRFSIFWRLLTRPLKLLAMTHHFPCFLCHILCWFLWEKFTTLLFLWRKFSFIFDFDWVWLNGHVSRCYECYFWAVTLKNSCPDFTLKNGENRDKYEWAAA